MYDLDQTVRRVMAFVDRPGDAISWENTLLIVTSDHSNSYMRLGARLGLGDLPQQTGTPDAGGISPAAGSSFAYPGGEVSYHTTNHTNELVTLYATGAGIEHLRAFEGLWNQGTRCIDNTHIFFAMCRAMGVDPGREPLIPAVRSSY